MFFILLFAGMLCLAIPMATVGLLFKILKLLFWQLLRSHQKVKL